MHVKFSFIMFTVLAFTNSALVIDFSQGQDIIMKDLYIVYSANAVTIQVDVVHKHQLAI